MSQSSSGTPMPETWPWHCTTVSGPMPDGMSSATESPVSRIHAGLFPFLFLLQNDQNIADRFNRKSPCHHRHLYYGKRLILCRPRPAESVGVKGRRSCGSPLVLFHLQNIQDFAQASSPLFGALVPFATAVMLLGTVNAEIFCSSRTIFQAAHQGDLPAFLSVVHAKTGSYRAALLLQMSICIGMTFIDVETVINYVSFVMWSQKLTTMVALFYIKTKKLEVDPGMFFFLIVIN